MKNAIVSLVMVAMIVTLPFVAFSGSFYQKELEVLIQKNTPDGDMVSGGMQAARWSSDSRQMIGCEVTTDGTLKNVKCFAIDAYGVQESCSVTNSAYADIAAGINSTSVIIFYCTGTNKTVLKGLRVWNYSYTMNN